MRKHIFMFRVKRGKRKMTNGEKIKAMFPSVIIGFITESQVGVYFVKNQHSATVLSLDWWNAEYKEPTTKNDLAVDCVSRKEVEKLVNRFLIKATDENIAFYEHFLDLPSVTPPKIVQIAGIEYDENKLKELVNKAVLTVTPQEPRKGHWIVNKEKDTICCSCCHDKQKIGKDEVELLDTAFTGFRFCKYCGADMRGKEE